MRLSLLPALLTGLAVLSLAACNQETPSTATDAGFETPDAAAAGLDAATPPDASYGAELPDANPSPPDASAPQETIQVSCVGPTAPVRANTRVDVNCTVDNGGRPVSAPVLTASPSAGTVLQKGSSELQMAFSLSTGSYLHPVDFADTTYTLTYEVHDAADASRFGKASVVVTVLGNYWIGDLADYGQGVLAYASDGTPIGGAIGPTAVTGVYDLRLLPDGNVAVASLRKKAVKVFTRKGALVSRTFPDTDPFTSEPLWSATYTNEGPHQMAVVGDELWVAGAKEGSDFGLAVFSWKTGSFQKFIANPSPSYSFQFTSIVARKDGTVLASSDKNRTICIFEAATHAPKVGTPCASVGEQFCDGWSSFVSLADGTVVGAQKGVSSGNLGCPFSFIGPNLELTGSKKPSEGIGVYGLLDGGSELTGVALSEITTEGFFIGVNPSTLATSSSDWRILKLLGGSTLMNPSGLVRLTPP